MREKQNTLVQIGKEHQLCDYRKLKMKESKAEYERQKEAEVAAEKKLQKYQQIADGARAEMIRVRGTHPPRPQRRSSLHSVQKSACGIMFVPSKTLVVLRYGDL